jgi:hypothetical protein
MHYVKERFLEKVMLKVRSGGRGQRYCMCKGPVAKGAG